jgi:branched-chain amino acid transport system ATP-binding protein
MSALLEVRHISRAFRTTLAVDDVSFEVQPGELLGLIGPNGAGKSTLFNLIAGVIAPSSGQIIFDGKPIQGWKSHDIARVGVARTFQIPKPYRQLSVIENVMLSAFLREKSVAGARKLAETTLADVGLAGYGGSPASSLTVGLLKRLEVARALAMRPKLVLFDEIMAGLTPTEVGAIGRSVSAACCV